MNSLIAETLSENQTLYENNAYNFSCGHFVIFLPILAKKLVAMATSLRLLQIAMSSLDWLASGH